MSMMKAVVFDHFGPPEVLRVVEMARPVPGRGQLLIRTNAVGVQPFDTAVRRGEMPVPVRFPQQLGNEFSGVVERAGADTAAWSPGDAVLGWAPLSSLAEYVVADEDAVVRKPADMPWEVAGCLGASGQTALTALRELRVADGDTLLVHAAAGGAGTVAVQLARHRRARVIGTASERNHTYLAGLGAIPVTYGPGLVERVRAIAPQGVDAVLDGIGGQALYDSLDLARSRDRIGTLVDHSVAASLGVRGIRAQRSLEQLSELVRLHEQGVVRITVRARFPMEDVVGAHREVERGHGIGKVVVTTDPEAPTP